VSDSQPGIHRPHGSPYNRHRIIRYGNTLYPEILEPIIPADVNVISINYRGHSDATKDDDWRVLRTFHWLPQILSNTHCWMLTHRTSRTFNCGGTFWYGYSSAFLFCFRFFFNFLPRGASYESTVCAIAIPSAHLSFRFSVCLLHSSKRRNNDLLAGSDKSFTIGLAYRKTFVTGC